MTDDAVDPNPVVHMGVADEHGIERGQYPFGQVMQLAAVEQQVAASRATRTSSSGSSSSPAKKVGSRLRKGKLDGHCFGTFLLHR